MGQEKSSSDNNQGNWGQEFSSSTSSSADQGNWGQEVPQYDGIDDNDSYSTSNLLKEKIIAEITEVLQFILVKRTDVRSRFDIPYIAQYKKEYVATNLKYEDLWTIYEYDEKWCGLQSKKLSQSVRDMYKESEMDGIDLYQSLIKHASNIEDVEDLVAHFQLCSCQVSSNKDSTERKKRRSSRRDPYTLAKQSNINEFVSLIGISTFQYSENLSLN